MNGLDFVTHNANYILDKIITEYDLHKILKVDSEMKCNMKHSRTNPEIELESSSVIFMKNYLDIRVRH
jgi:hypothetical protein